jgi:iron complex outermembrane receptor protein
MSAFGSRSASLRTSALLGASILALSLTGTAAGAQETAFKFDIPQQPLSEALRAYARVAGDEIIFNDDQVRGRTATLHGTYTADEALTKILHGSKLAAKRLAPNEVMVGPAPKASSSNEPVIHLAEAAPAPMRAASGVETVVVTSSKIKGDIQTVPIAITALSQEQLTSRQIAGGPDLVKEVPNLTFTKTNFTGYSINIRGIGTEAISVTTDPAVAVAFNDTPFIRNHFFEQEFFDVSQVEVLRGPQGTLYGRNATAGVVNVVSAKPTDKFEAMLSADWGNYSNRRYEGMINLPIVGDKLMLRIAGEWTKRDGYSFNQTTNKPIDGRDLWSSRMSLRWKPVSTVTADFIWEHFQEDDDRLRSGKQLCHRDNGPSTLTAANGAVVDVAPANGGVFTVTAANFSQGCLPHSLYDKAPNGAFQVVNGYSLPFVKGGAIYGFVDNFVDPYARATQSTNLRDIQSEVSPIYKANNDTLELNTEWNVTPALNFYSDTGYNRDFLWSTEDYNRFDTRPGVFVYNTNLGGDYNAWLMNPTGNFLCGDGTYFVGGTISQCNGHSGVDQSHETGYFCDPQLGCSDRLVVQDLAEEHSWQFSQEFRLASDFKGPFNFSGGGNYLHYETEENYYVFSNTFTMMSLSQTGCGGSTYIPNVTNNLFCLQNDGQYWPPAVAATTLLGSTPQYVDPNPLTSVNGEGHNYFLSQNPYVLNSYALFGEAYYDLAKDLKLTGGLRWTDDQKHFTIIPSELLTYGYGYPSAGQADRAWKKFTGRAVVNWTPKLSFTDQTMVYASFAHGYKAGGQNPPGPVLLNADTAGASVNITIPTHPLDFKPEFVNAYELGTKNTLLDGALTLNGDVFFYDYTGYQISQIVDRTSVNLNFNATVDGAELEATYEPLPGLKFSFAGGYESTRIKAGQSAIDLMDRTAGRAGWVVMKPSVGQSSNCILPEYVAAAVVQAFGSGSVTNLGGAQSYVCGSAYTAHVDPITGLNYDTETGNGAHSPTGNAQDYTSAPAGYPGFDPVSDDTLVDPATVNNGLGLVPNNGEGFAKNVGGNQLPNAPHYTASLTADYTMPVSANWAATLHSDFYWQSQSFARVFNDRPYDKIRGYSNVNLALILTDASGWQVMGYVKNIFDTTAITGDFLNSDDSGLTTNVFLTDPRLFGVRVTKNFEGGADDSGIFGGPDGGRPQIWITLGGNYNNMLEAKADPYDPLALPNFPNGGDATPPWAAGLPTPRSLQKSPNSGFDWEADLSYQPSGSDWKLMAGVRYGRSARNNYVHKSQYAFTNDEFNAGVFGTQSCSFISTVGALFPSINHYQISHDVQRCEHGTNHEFVDSHASSSEQHEILDFEVGKNVGIGLFGTAGTGTLSGGVRIAQFNFRNGMTLLSDPHYPEPAGLPSFFTHKYHDVYDFYVDEHRSFNGIGPEVNWDASNPVWGDVQNGQVALDWGVNLGALFGDETVHLHHVVKHCTISNAISPQSCNNSGNGGVGDVRTVEPPDDVTRSNRVTVPNLGAHLGLSINYRNAKISFGYRADEFFGAIDGGQYSVHRFNRGFNGAYANISIGLGD